jgi:hypothetical protein
MLKHMKMGWNSVATNWQAAAGYILATVLLLCLYGYRLGTLVPAYSAPEIAARQSSSSIQEIADNPINLPHKTGQFLLLKLGKRGPAAMRAVSVLFAIAAVWLFYSLLMRWHTQRIAVLGTTLFATNSWFLHSARLGTPDILLTAIVAIICCGFYIRFGRVRSQAWLVTSLVVGLALYVPMMAWFIVLGGLWQSKRIVESFRLLATPVVIACIGIVIGLLLPLAVAIMRQPDLWHELTGIPQSFAPVKETAEAALNTLSMFFYKAQANPVHWLGRLPILDIFAGVMFIFGVYAYAYKLRLHRTQLLIVTIIIGTVLVALSMDYQNVTLLLPVIYLIVTAGVTLMLQQWFTVFPRNPIARNIGLGMMVGALVLACSYQVINYFVAWPNNPDTKAAYTIKP